MPSIEIEMAASGYPVTDALWEGEVEVMFLYADNLIHDGYTFKSDKR